MSYIENNLLPDEQIIYKTKLHNIIFLKPIVFLLIGILLFFTGMAGIQIGTFIILFIFIPMLINAFVAKTTSEFVVTNKRIVIKVGWISRRILELNNSKIEGVGVDQGILGRAFNFGTIFISGTGTSKQHFKNIVNPLEFRKQVHNQISK